MKRCPTCKRLVKRKSVVNADEAKELRSLGYSYKEIGNLYGVSHVTTFRAVNGRKDRPQFESEEFVSEDKAELLEIKKDMHAIQDLMARLSQIVESQQKSIEGIKVKLEEMRRGNQG